MERNGHAQATTGGPAAPRWAGPEPGPRAVAGRPPAPVVPLPPRSVRRPAPPRAAPPRAVPPRAAPLRAVPPPRGAPLHVVPPPAAPRAGRPALSNPFPPGPFPLDPLPPDPRRPTAGPDPAGPGPASPPSAPPPPAPLRLAAPAAPAPAPVARRRVTVRRGDAAVDVSLPGDRAAADLLPELLDLLGGDAAAGTAARPAGGWVLRTLTGTTVHGTLEDAGVRHGAELLLEAAEPAVPEPRVDDVAAALGRLRSQVRRPLARAAVARALLAVLGGAAAWWTGSAAADGAPSDAPAYGLLALLVALAWAAVTAAVVRRDAAGAATAWCAAAGLPSWAVGGVLLAPPGALPGTVGAGVALVVGSALLFAACRGAAAHASGAHAAPRAGAAEASPPGPRVLRTPAAVPAAALPAGVVTALAALAAIQLGRGLVEAAAVAVVLGCALQGVAPRLALSASGLVRLRGGPELGRGRVADAATRAQLLLGAIRGGMLVPVVLAWPALLAAGGVPAVIALVAATALLVRGARPHHGADGTVADVTAAVALVALTGAATTALAAEQGPALATAVPVVVAALVLGALSAVGRVTEETWARTARWARRGETLAHVVLPSLVLLVLGAYQELQRLASGIAG